MPSWAAAYQTIFFSGLVRAGGRQDYIPPIQISIAAWLQCHGYWAYPTTILAREVFIRFSLFCIAFLWFYIAVFGFSFFFFFFFFFFLRFSLFLSLIFIGFFAFLFYFFIFSTCLFFLAHV